VLARVPELDILQAKNNGLESDIRVVRTELDATAEKNRLLETNFGSLLYALGSDYVAILDPVENRVISLLKAPHLEDLRLGYANHQLDYKGRVWGVNSNGEAYPVNLVTGETEGKVLLEPSSFLIADVGRDGRHVYAHTSIPRGIKRVEDSPESTLFKIDVSTLQVVDKISVGKFACDIDINPDGTKAFLPNQLGGTVTVVDLKSFKVEGIISAPVGGNMLTVTGGGRYVFVENHHSGAWAEELKPALEKQMPVREYVIDTQSMTIVKEFPLEEEPGINEVSPTDEITIVTGQTGVWVFSVKTLSLVATIPIKRPGTPGYSSDGKHAYIPSREDNNITIVDTENFQVSKKLEFAKPPSVVINERLVR
ncbi:MAG: YncE family protein, partial [Thaumarchaeota archaeon]|nr:YncE family protein [Nitrososphaerota archaeon]